MRVSEEAVTSESATGPSMDDIGTTPTSSDKPGWRREMFVLLCVPIGSTVRVEL